MVDYTVTISNTGTGTQVDNPGDEFTDTLPAQLTFQSASASSGSISVGRQHRQVERLDSRRRQREDRDLGEVNAGTTGVTVVNQGTVNFDPNHSGTNSSSVLTDDPGVGGAANPTPFVVAAVIRAAAHVRRLDGQRHESLHADEPVSFVPGTRSH